MSFWRDNSLFWGVLAVMAVLSASLFWLAHRTRRRENLAIEVTSAPARQDAAIYCGSCTAGSLVRCTCETRCANKFCDPASERTIMMNPHYVPLPRITPPHVIVMRPRPAKARVMLAIEVPRKPLRASWELVDGRWAAPELNLPDHHWLRELLEAQVAA